MVSDGSRSDALLLSSSKRRALNHEAGALWSIRSTLCPPCATQQVRAVCALSASRALAWDCAFVLPPSLSFEMYRLWNVQKGKVDVPHEQPEERSIRPLRW